MWKYFIFMCDSFGFYLCLGFCLGIIVSSCLIYTVDDISRETNKAWCNSVVSFVVGVVVVALSVYEKWFCVSFIPFTPLSLSLVYISRSLHCYLSTVRTICWFFVCLFFSFLCSFRFVLCFSLSLFRTVDMFFSSSPFSVRASFFLFSVVKICVFSFSSFIKQFSTSFSLTTASQPASHSVDR